MPIQLMRSHSGLKAYHQRRLLRAVADAGAVLTLELEAERTAQHGFEGKGERKGKRLGR